MRIFWLTVGYVSLALGFAGVILPLLPTTPFLILSAFGFSKSSPRFEKWLLEHRQFGPAIRSWRRNRAVPRRAKILASVFMGLALIGGYWAGLETVLYIQIVVFAAVLIFLWTRPDG